MSNPELSLHPQSDDPIDRLPKYELAKFSDEDLSIAEPLLKYNGIFWNDAFMDLYESLIEKYGKQKVEETRLRHILGGSGPRQEFLKYPFDTDQNEFQNFIEEMSSKLQKEAA